MVRGGRTKDNGRNGKGERFCWERRTTFFPRSSAKCWNRSSREAGQSLSLGLLKFVLNQTLNHLVKLCFSQDELQIPVVLWSPHVLWDGCQSQPCTPGTLGPLERALPIYGQITDAQYYYIYILKHSTSTF